VPQVKQAQVAVVGGGLAGLTAALAALREGCSVRLFDDLGGGGRLLNIEELHDYPLVGDARAGQDIASELLEAAMDHGADLACDRVSRIWRDGDWIVESGTDVTAAVAVVVASGQGDGTLGLPGEEKLHGRGISYCAACDAPLFASKRTVVVGSGNWPVAEAIHLSQVAETLLAYPSAEPGCSPGWRRRLEESAVECVPGARPAEIRTANGVVSALLVDIGDERRVIEAEGIFPLLHRPPATSFLPAELAGVAADGHLPIDGDGAAGAAGLFAAGDVTRTGDGLAIQAAAEGLRAGLSAASFAKDGAR
jgi:thioredoxin reductase (NADPH)